MMVRRTSLKTLSSPRRLVFITRGSLRRINVDFPLWVVDSLDREAAHRGVTRQSLIKVWLVERLQVEQASAAVAKGDESER